MLLGRLLITFSLIATIVGPIRADCNRTHIFNPEWPPHARFHAIAGLCMTTGFSLIGLWLLWAGLSCFPRFLVSAAIPVISWGSFFLAAITPGAGVEDHPGSISRIFGLPINLFVALIFSAIAIAGYILCVSAQVAQ